MSAVLELFVQSHTFDARVHSARYVGTKIYPRTILVQV